jgi:hypothetical protein
MIKINRPDWSEADPETQQLYEDLFDTLDSIAISINSIEKKIDRINQIVLDEAKHTRLNADYVTPSAGGMSKGRCPI